MQSQLQKPALTQSDDVLRKKKAQKTQNAISQVTNAKGSELETDVKSDMESHFSRDFSQVRVHTDSSANRAAQSVNAAAYTYGNDIAFGPGQYQPHSESGRKLLAHELAHTVQQSSHRQLAAKSLSTGTESQLECEADRAADLVASNQPVSINFTPTSNAIQRKALPGIGEAIEPSKEQPTEMEEEEPKKKDSLIASLLSTGGNESPTLSFESAVNTASSLISPALPQALGPGKEPATAAPESNEKAPSATESNTLDVENSSSQETDNTEQADLANNRKPTSLRPAKLDDVKDTPVEGEDRGRASSKQKNKKVQDSTDTGKQPKTAIEKPSPRKEIGPVIKQVRQRAKKASNHSPPKQLGDSAVKSGMNPSVEQDRLASSATVNNIEASKKEPVAQKSFGDQLKEALAKAVPKPESPEKAKELTKTGGKDTSNAIKGKLGGAIEPAVANLKENASKQGEISPASQPAEPQTKMVTEKKGAPSKSVAAEPVVPKPIPESHLDYSDHASPTDDLMKTNHVSVEQLGQGNEQEFNSLIQSRSEASQHQDQAAKQYREQEKVDHGSTEAAATKLIATGLSGFDKARATGLGKTKESQMATQSKEAGERQRITKEIRSIKDQTQTEVNTVLTNMESTAQSMFETALKQAEGVYKSVFDDVRDSWYEGWFDGVSDKEQLQQSLDTARKAYYAHVTGAINFIAAFVDLQIVLAKNKVAQGRQKIQQYVDSLDSGSKQFGMDAAKEIASEFQDMTSSIDQRSDRLVDGLVEQYRGSQTRLAETEKQLREANKSIWEKIKDATVGVIQKIAEFKNLLLSVLAGAMKLVLDIVANPIGFLSNLVRGVRQGFNLFIANIGKHLKSGLMGWLFGAMESAGVDIPKSLDFKSILKLVVQILGFSRQFIRGIAVKVLGKETVSRIESTVTFFQILMRDGLAGVWQLVQEKLTGLKETVFGQIKAFVTSKIIQAGIGMIFKLINPAGAFFAACQMIYRFVKFIMERGKQIAELVQAVVGSIGAIVKGNVEAMATKIHEALARTVPVAISLFANLIGFGGVSKRIRNIIGSVRKKVEKAILSLIRKAAGMLSRKGKKKKSGESEGKWEKKYGPEKGAKIEAGLAAINQKEKPYLDEEKEIEKHEAERVAAEVKPDHRVFRTLYVYDAGDVLQYKFSASSESVGLETNEEQGVGAVKPPGKITKQSASWRNDNVNAEPLTGLAKTPSKTASLDSLYQQYNKEIPGFNSQYVRAHLLHNKFGPDAPWNLVFATGSANQKMQNEVEGSVVQNFENGPKKPMYYQVEVTRNKEWPRFADFIHYVYGYYDLERDQRLEPIGHNDIESDPPKLDSIKVNEASLSQLVAVGVDTALARAVVEEAKIEKFVSRREMKDRLLARGINKKLVNRFEKLFKSKSRVLALSVTHKRKTK